MKSRVLGALGASDNVSVGDGAGVELLKTEDGKKAFELGAVVVALLLGVGVDIGIGIVVPLKVLFGCGVVWSILSFDARLRISLTAKSASTFISAGNRSWWQRSSTCFSANRRSKQANGSVSSVKTATESSALQNNRVLPRIQFSIFDTARVLSDSISNFFSQLQHPQVGLESYEPVIRIVRLHGFCVVLFRTSLQHLRDRRDVRSGSDSV